MLRIVVSVFLLLIMGSANVFAMDKKDVPEYKQTKSGKYLSAKEAYAAIQSEGNNILFLDIRTRAEISVVGMPTVADANIPFSLMAEPMIWNNESGGFKMIRNKYFLSAVNQRLREKGLSTDSKIFLMCRSGGRSASAADLLSEAGFSNVYSVVDGFEGDKSRNGQRILNGWKNSDLPWSYKLDKQKMYLPD